MIFQPSQGLKSWEGWRAGQNIYYIKDYLRHASKLRSNFACEMIFQMKSWEGWSAGQRMTRRPTVVHLLLLTGFIFSQRWTLSSFYLMPTWAFEFFIAFCPAAPLRALQGYELQLQVLLFGHLQTLTCLFVATCEQMNKNTNTLQKDLNPSVFSSEQQRHVWIAFPKWPMACFLWIPRILLCCFAKHSLWPLILFSLRYDLLLLGKDNALNCGWLSYAERSTCAGKSSHQARPGYSASSKICTYCSSSQTGVGYAAYYRQCAGD